MTDRRAFLAGMLATGLAPAPGWADVGAPRYLSAAAKPDGSFVLCGLSAKGNIKFEIALPGRGHAAAAHPKRPEAVAFARRPGTYAVILDCAIGQARARLSAPEGRHFYGHGAFSADGDLLFTTENDYQRAAGVVGVWDSRKGYARVTEFPSGGIGPHDIKLMPGGETLAIANGGIETHPETGRGKLNIPTMRPNLALVRQSGGVEDILELDTSLHRNSIRHLAVGHRGEIAFALQWQGDTTDAVPLLGLRKPDGTARLLGPGESQMLGYAGSVAIDRSGHRAAITSPRGGVFQVFDLATGKVALEEKLPDVCGIVAAEYGFAITSGTGVFETMSERLDRSRSKFDMHWDNHLVEIGWCPRLSIGIAPVGSER